MRSDCDKKLHCLSGCPARQAITELEQAAKLDPTYPEPHYAMARIQRKIGNLQAAAKEIQLFEDLRKTDKLKGITRPD